jgi:NADH-quinone oxidoreductase subunit M
MIYIIFDKTNNFQDAYMAMEGSMVQMISHAFGSGAMFLAFGVLYEQMHTRQISHFGGIAQTMPVFAAFFMLFAMSNVALPGTSGFVGEFMVILSTFKANFWVTALASLTLIVGAIYTLWMYKRVFYGDIINQQVAELKDVGRHEIVLFALLAVAILFIGLYPMPMIELFHASVGHIIELSTTSKL